MSTRKVLNKRGEELEGKEKKKTSSLLTKRKKATRNNDVEDDDDVYGDSYSESEEEKTTKKRKMKGKTNKPKTVNKRERAVVVKAGKGEAAAPPSFPSSLKLLGYHSSSQGGVDKAIERARKNGARSMALFLRQGRAWNAAPYTQGEVEKFKKELSTSPFTHSLVLPHGNYLVNLCSPDEVIRSKSFDVFCEEVQRCESLGLSLLNIHPGSSRKELSVETCTQLIGEAINKVHTRSKEVKIVLENTAGAGGTIGKNFNELKMIIDHVTDQSRVGVCLDTCHLFAAGYDITTKEKFEKVMEDFNQQIGMKYLMGIHLNDCKSKFGSFSDRHANIGQGNIGLDCFRFVMNDDRFNNLPIILETPPCDFNEFSLLYSLEEKKETNSGPQEMITSVETIEVDENNAFDGDDEKCDSHDELH